MTTRNLAAACTLGVVILGVGPAAFPRESRDPADLTAYIAEIRKAGMTDSAKGSLSFTASIRSGGTILSFQKDEATGQYSRSYRSTACPLPNADPNKIERLQSELRAREATDIEVLRRYADADRSGFVTTAEGGDFRDLLEFGYLAAHVVEVEGPKIELVARATSMPPDAAAARVREYNELARTLNEATEVKSPLIKLP